MSLLSWWTNTFSTMPRMFTGGLGKNSNQCWHQFTDRTNKTEKRKKYNWNVKASDILDKFSTNFRLSNAKILVKLSFDKLWTCLKRLYNLIIIIFFYWTVRFPTLTRFCLLWPLIGSKNYLRLPLLARSDCVQIITAVWLWVVPL